MGAIALEKKQGSRRLAFLSAPREYAVAVGVPVLVLLLLVVPPALFLMHLSFYPRAIDGSVGAFTTEFYHRIVGRPTFVNSLVNTLFFSLGTASLAIALGALQAWIVERTDTPLRLLSRILSVTSLGVPAIVYTIAWLLLLGKVGPINQGAMALFSSKDPLVSPHSLATMILVEGLIWTPLAFLMFSSTFRNIDPSLEEAARVSGASVASTLTRITLRLSFPAFAALAILVFCRALESFDVAFLVGVPGGVDVLSTDVFLAIKMQVPANYGEASAYSVALLIAVGFVLLLYRRVSRASHKYQTITGKGYRPRVMRLGRWRYLTAALLVGNFCLVFVLPMGMLLWTSLLTFYRPPSLEALPSITFDNFAFVLGSPTSREVIGNTLAMSVAAATIAVALTGVAGWLVARRRPGSALLDHLATAPLIFPNVVLGVAISQLYLRVPLPIYGTLTILIIAYTTRALPYGMRYSQAGALQIHRELEEAAEVGGASAAATLRRVVAPLLRPALAAAWLYVFLTASRELSMALLLAGPDSRVVSVAIYDLWVGGGVEQLAALGLCWMLLMMIAAAVFYYFSQRYGISE